MTFTQKAVEAAARAIAETRGAIWTRPDHTVSATFDHDAAMASLSAALAVDGVALVPNEPTRAMIDAAFKFDWGPGVNCDDHDASPWNVYQAMLTAANDGEERR
jgi:hypothetical protein